MTFNIAKDSRGGRKIIRLNGQLRLEHLGALRAEIQSSPSRVVLNLDAVSVVDVAAARFLKACEQSGIELLNCWPYMREWMLRQEAENPTPLEVQ